MKMGAGLFWGIVLITIGLSIIFKVAFGVNIMRIIIAIVFILIGVKILIGKQSVNVSSKNNDVIFNERFFSEFPIKNTEYNTVFGKSVFNFGNAAIPTDKTIHLEFNTVFGDTKLILPPGLAVRIKSDAFFGSANLPNNNTTVFGSVKYVSDHDSAATSFVIIKTSTVFGNIDIIQKRPTF